MIKPIPLAFPWKKCSQNKQDVPLARVTSDEQVLLFEDTEKKCSVSSWVLKVDTYAAVNSATVVREKLSDPRAWNGA